MEIVRMRTGGFGTRPYGQINGDHECNLTHLSVFLNCKPKDIAMHKRTALITHDLFNSKP
jgi:hypothetical protein